MKYDVIFFPNSAVISSDKAIGLKKQCVGLHSHSFAILATLALLSEEHYWLFSLRI